MIIYITINATKTPNIIKPTNFPVLMTGGYMEENLNLFGEESVL